jgi:hypothetical protein
MKPKIKKQHTQVSNKAEQKAWELVVMSIAAISNLEANYRDKKVMLDFESSMEMISFLHLTDLIFAGASEGKHKAEQS